MSNLSQIIVALLAGISGAYFQSLFERKKQLKEQEHELKSKRYLSIIIQMLTILDPENGLRHASEFRPDLKNIQDFKNEVEAELLNSILFASDDVIKKMANFISNPDYSSYIKVVSAMRKDLWGKRTSIDERSLSFLVRNKS
ncbi:MAG: hypothetical protein PHC29_02410 [Candidatus Omnitrophica bacterium]|nr:hypothetical protein [Candidatus Omnitrophota bacterium]